MPKFLETCISTFLSIAQLTASDIRQSSFLYCKQVQHHLIWIRQFALFCLQKVIYMALEIKPDIFRDNFTFSPFPTLAILLDELPGNHPLFCIAKTMYTEYKEISLFVKFESQTKDKVKVFLSNNHKQETETEESQNSQELSIKNIEQIIIAIPKPKTQMGRKMELPPVFKEQILLLTHTKIPTEDQLNINLEFNTISDFLSYFSHNEDQFSRMFHLLILLPEIKIVNDQFFALHFSPISNVIELFKYLIHPFDCPLPDFFLPLLNSKIPDHSNLSLPVFTDFHNSSPAFLYSPQKHNTCLLRSSMTLSFLVKYIHHKQLFALHKNYFTDFSFLISRIFFQTTFQKFNSFRLGSCCNAPRIPIHQRTLSHFAKND